jgi:hypothetical protein
VQILYGTLPAFFTVTLHNRRVQDKDGGKEIERRGRDEGKGWKVGGNGSGVGCRVSLVTRDNK